jgi:hypothetical protein
MSASGVALSKRAPHQGLRAFDQQERKHVREIQIPTLQRNGRCRVAASGVRIVSSLEILTAVLSILGLVRVSALARLPLTLGRRALALVKGRHR